MQLLTHEVRSRVGSMLARCTPPNDIPARRTHDPAPMRPPLDTRTCMAVACSGRDGWCANGQVHGLERYQRDRYPEVWGQGSGRVSITVGSCDGEERQHGEAVWQNRQGRVNCI